MTATVADSDPLAHAEACRLGCVSYLNTAPLIEGLGKWRDARLTLTAPSRLIDLLLADQIDLGLISLIDYQRSPEPLVLIPSGMIGCDGETLTVRLFSRVPIPSLTRVCVDADSHTSVVLLRVLLAECFGIRPEIVERDLDGAGEASAARAECQAVLAIGDKVVTGALNERTHPHQLDLGRAWREHTGLPFVYAVWMCREASADDRRVRTAAAMLDRQRRHNATRADWIVSARAPRHGWPRDIARRYLRQLLRYDIADGHRRAIDLFFDKAHEHGLIERRRPTRWLA